MTVHPIVVTNAEFFISLFGLTGQSQQHISEDHRTRSSNLSGRASSQTNVYLDTFGYQDNSRAFDTLSVDSSDSMETSISACSPDNVSR